MAHTPGPWTPEGPVAYGYNIYAARSGVWIGDACGPHDGAPGFPGDEEADANAHLIAAAPDMLEALEAAKVALTSWDRPERLYTPEEEKALDLIEAAIRKARGGEVG